jgi:methylmalonyl-CoA mutase cobalamin-binding subunit
VIISKIKMKSFQDVRESLQKSEVFTNFQKIIDGLYIGPQTSSMKIEKLKQEGVTQILKVNVGYPAIFPFHKYGIELKEIGLEDHPNYKINEEEEL